MVRRTADQYLAAASPILHGGREIEIIPDPGLTTWGAASGSEARIWYYPDQAPRHLLTTILHEDWHQFTIEHGWQDRLGAREEETLVTQLAAYDAERYIRNPKLIEALVWLARKK